MTSLVLCTMMASVLLILGKAKVHKEAGGEDKWSSLFTKEQPALLTLITINGKTDLVDVIRYAFGCTISYAKHQHFLISLACYFLGCTGVL